MRIARLFRPYRDRLSAVGGLIAGSALLGTASPFLLRQVLDTAIPQRDTHLLALLVAGMVAISVLTGALGVAQTYLSNAVGQRGMHDLRRAGHRHPQRPPPPFVTPPRPGEVQPRPAHNVD